jgi:hypothetical protein
MKSDNIDNVGIAFDRYFLIQVILRHHLLILIGLNLRWLVMMN